LWEDAVTEAQANRRKTKWVLVAIIAGFVVAGYFKSTQIAAGYATQGEVRAAVLMGVVAFVALAVLQIIDWSNEYIASRDLLKNSHW
jgi:hypothetical protein